MTIQSRKEPEIKRMEASLKYDPAFPHGKVIITYEDGTKKERPILATKSRGDIGALKRALGVQ